MTVTPPPPAPPKLYFHIVFNKSIKVLLFLFLCSPRGGGPELVPGLVALGGMGAAGM